MGFSIFTIITLVTVAMQIMALPALMKRQVSGWNMMFYVSLINLVENMLRTDVGGLLISGVVSFYILFQVKSYYK
jgi:hypothetical protein